MGEHNIDLKKKLNKEDIVTILESKDPLLAEALFERARSVRQENFGDKIFIYGFVYFSTYCRNNCNFCLYRKSNDIRRYRKTSEEILDVVKQLAASGINLIDLTMGEDLSYHQEDFDSILGIVKRIKGEFNLPVMISPGVVEERIIDKFAEAGTDWYALYQETHNRELFSKLRISQDYDERMDRKLYAKERGMLIEEGLLAGVGETPEDIADSLLEMGRIGANQIRVMSFVPQEGSPMEGVATPDRIMERKIIALMRILYPTALIPASLDVDGIKGLKDRIDSGANVVTSIIPPHSGLMGVAQNTMDVDEGGRTAEEVDAILRTMDLRIATPLEYQDCLRSFPRETR